MTTLALNPTAAQLALVQADAENKMALMRRTAGDLKQTILNKDATIQDLGAKIHQMSLGLSQISPRQRVMLGLSTGFTCGAGYVGGLLDGWLEQAKADKVGPFKIMNTLALIAAATGVALSDIELAELVSAVARGFAAGPLYMAGREKGATAKAQQMAAAQAAPAPAPAPTQGKRG